MTNAESIPNTLDIEITSLGLPRHAIGLLLRLKITEVRKLIANNVIELAALSGRSPTDPVFTKIRKALAKIDRHLRGEEFQNILNH